jgi:hypothetical protein
MGTSTGINTPNLFHSDKFKVEFSNIPSLTNFRELGLYDHFVRSITIPDYNMDIVPSHLKNEVRRFPIAKANIELSQLQVEFKVDENFENYYNLFTWVQSVRYGQVDTNFIARNTVHTININILDNQKRERARLSFTECLLASISSLPLIMGSAEELVFTTQFMYEEIKLQKFPLVT